MDSALRVKAARTSKFAASAWSAEVATYASTRDNAASPRWLRMHLRGQSQTRQSHEDRGCKQGITQCHLEHRPLTQLPKPMDAARKEAPRHGPAPQD